MVLFIKDCIGLLCCKTDVVRGTCTASRFRLFVSGLFIFRNAQECTRNNKHPTEAESQFGNILEHLGAFTVIEVACGVWPLDDMHVPNLDYSFA